MTVFTVRIIESEKFEYKRILGVYSNKSKLWEAVESFYSENELVYDCLKTSTDCAWSYQTLCKAFKEYDRVIVILCGDEGTKYYDDKIKLEIEQHIVD
jgi:hypothetical protein